MTRNLRLHWPMLFLVAYVALIAVLLFAVPAHAAPSFSIAPATTLDNATSVTVTITKSAKASSYSKLHVFTNDGTALAAVDYGAVNKSITVANATLKIAIPIAIIPRAGYQGTRTFTVSIIPTRNGTTGSSTATVTINDSEPAPTPTPTPPPVPSGTWVAAPLTVGGYACSSISGMGNVPPCGQGIVYKITGAIPNGPSVIYTAVFYSDASGQFPLSDSYAVSFVGVWAPDQLQGLAPGQ